jgi:hypothetical protein
MEDISMKCNGLSSSTKIDKFTEDLGNGARREYHLHPETEEIIVMNTWYVQNGEDDVDHDFEVIEVIPKGGAVGKLKELLNK